MVVVVTYIRWRKGVKLPRLKMSPTIGSRRKADDDLDVVVRPLYHSKTFNLGACLRVKAGVGTLGKSHQNNNVCTQ